VNWDAVGAIGSLAGAAGVIASLIYLAWQVRQNTKASRLSAIQTANENSARLSEMLSTRPDVSELFWTGLSEPDTLSTPDRRRFITVLNAFMRREAAAYYLHREGALPDDLWATRLAVYSGILNQPGMKLYLDTAAYNLPAAFVELLRDINARESTLSPEAKRALGVRE